MNKIAKQINTIMNLRIPQSESLDVFEQISDILSLQKQCDLVSEAMKINKIRPTLTDFERSFPSITFALATGIGKTRLMGAFITYLHLMNISHNFFIVAPNLTIYNKLMIELTQISHVKYIFKGFNFRINVITGDDYEEFRESSNVHLDLGNEFNIYLFNISKINSEIKSKDQKPARFRRLNETLGKSFFDYLVGLKDLCIMMDESHHYHADRSFDSINELEPILGVEFTATPIIQRNGKSVPFKNVVYEYSLAQALKDEKYIKIPTVFTRENFHKGNMTEEELDRYKLRDGISVHLKTKAELDLYAHQHGKKFIKPFMLVVAKDTFHSAAIKSYLVSNEFFGGYYRDRILEINSSQSGSEKDENIQQLLTLEEDFNQKEIVLHVNMLKEGWDVKNLYTIVPLRASASDTLTEQTLGRGLRLPYSERTGNESIDTLSIISHDKYEDIIALANMESSLLRKVNFIDNSYEVTQMETVELPSAYDFDTRNENVIEQLVLEITATNLSDQSKNDITKSILNKASKMTMELNRITHSYSDVGNQENHSLMVGSIITNIKKEYKDLDLDYTNIQQITERIVDYCIQSLTQKIIPIPQAIVQPDTSVKKSFLSFIMNTKNMSWQAFEDQIIGQQLQKGGHVIHIDVKDENDLRKDYKNRILKYIIAHENIDYEQNADLIYDLIKQVEEHFSKYLNNEDITKVFNQNLKFIADSIYIQMCEHMYEEEITYGVENMRSFSKIESGFGNKIKDESIKSINETVAPNKLGVTIFNGFSKSCHTMYKFDSMPELKFARILETDTIVLKWMRPSVKQFNIYYDRKNDFRYEPDFIVETEQKIFMIEVKAYNMTENNIVLMKAKAAIEYCNSATEYNFENGGKRWEYCLITDKSINSQSTFNFLINHAEQFNQITFEI